IRSRPQANPHPDPGAFGRGDGAGLAPVTGPGVHHLVGATVAGASAHLRTLYRLGGGDAVCDPARCPSGDPAVPELVRPLRSAATVGQGGVPTAPRRRDRCLWPAARGGSDLVRGREAGLSSAGEGGLLAASGSASQPTGPVS